MTTKGIAHLKHYAALKGMRGKKLKGAIKLSLNKGPSLDQEWHFMRDGGSMVGVHMGDSLGGERRGVHIGKSKCITRLNWQFFHRPLSEINLY